jgi:hypothetical protein
MDEFNAVLASTYAAAGPSMSEAEKAAVRGGRLLQPANARVTHRWMSVEIPRPDLNGDRPAAQRARHANSGSVSAAAVASQPCSGRWASLGASP